MEGMAGLHGKPVRQLNPSSRTDAHRSQPWLSHGSAVKYGNHKLWRSETQPDWHIQRNVICPTWAESDNSVHLVPASQMTPQEAEFPWCWVRHMQKTWTKRHGGNVLEHQLGVITCPSSCEFQWQFCSASSVLPLWQSYLKCSNYACR